MAHIFCSSHIEGQSTTCSPFLDGTNYGYWKKMISCFLMQNISILQIVMERVHLPNMENMKEWTEENKRTVKINAKAMNTVVIS